MLRTIARDGLLDHVKRVGERLRDAASTALGHPLIADVRGAGLLLGIVLDRAGRGGRWSTRCATGRLPGQRGAAPDVLRLAPPLILSAEQADAFVAPPLADGA